MKYKILILLCFFIISELKAQTVDETKQFMRSVPLPKKILYVDSANIFIPEMRKLLDKDTIRTLMEGAHDFIITKDERRYINQELDAMQSFAWPVGLLDSSKMITAKKLRKVIGKNPKNWGYVHKHYGDSFYYFSKPIFFRNNTLAIFYRGSYCDWTLCGNGELDIYDKENGKWFPKYLLAAWQL